MSESEDAEVNVDNDSDSSESYKDSKTEKEEDLNAETTEVKGEESIAPDGEILNFFSL